MGEEEGGRVLGRRGGEGAVGGVDGGLQCLLYTVEPSIRTLQKKEHLSIKDKSTRSTVVHFNCQREDNLSIKDTL